MSKQTEKGTQKQEFKMEQLFAMWLKKSKNGASYLTGRTDKGMRLVGFFNGKKNNPKEPDVRIYEMDADGNMGKEEYISLWVNVSKNDKKYLSGKLNGERVVGFINRSAKAGGKTPYFSVYKSDSEKQPETKKSEGFESIPDGIDENLPFD